ncbi:PP2C family protein-serine/threonine phosphatase [Aquipuribacter hungaricus]|uniref:PP2C family protein-serine/threonine phosphatase n=3 Tax=Aquipuribacter hungaricus TaxID=545624 RepID=A0ABV7WG21_9MICO
MAAAITFDLRALLDGVEAAPPMGGVEALASELAAKVGASEVSFLIADLLGGSLVRLARAQPPGHPPASRAAPGAVAAGGTPAGAALRTQQVQIEAAEAAAGEDPEQVRVFAPVTARGEAVGVLELLLAGPPDEVQLAYLGEAAHALAYVVIADRRYTDLYEWGQRSVPLSLQAEIQRRLLPGSYTCEAGRFTLAGWQVPAHDAGGDTFDFALDQDTLHLSITDAVGHGVVSALLATLVVSSLRNSRRARTSVLEQAQRAAADLAAHATPEQYVTGQLVRVDMATGTCQVVNAGHVAPLLVRDGQVTDVVLDADPPFGLLPGSAYRSQTFRLQAGDRLVLLTDGMLEREAAGADVRGVLRQVVDQHPREVVQVLTRAVLAATEDQLRDDATVMVVDWYGGPEAPRTATAGATRDRAST